MFAMVDVEFGDKFENIDEAAEVSRSEVAL